MNDVLYGVRVNLRALSQFASLQVHRPLQGGVFYLLQQLKIQYLQLK